MKDILREEIDDAIMGVLVKHQDRLGITSGDDIGDLILEEKYNDSLDFLSVYLCKILAFQCTTNGIESRDADDLINDYL